MSLLPSLNPNLSKLSSWTRWEPKNVPVLPLSTFQLAKMTRFFCFESKFVFLEKHYHVFFFTWREKNVRTTVVGQQQKNCDDIKRSSFFLGNEYFVKLRNVKVMQESSSEDFQSIIIFLPKNLGLARQRRLQQLQAEGLLEIYSKKTQQPIRLSDCSECWNVILVCHAKNPKCM